MQRYSWEQGVCAQAFLESGDDEIVVQLCYDAINRQTPDGRPCNMGGQHGVTDPVAILPALIRACELTGDPHLIAGLDRAWKWVFEGAPRSEGGVIYHMDDTHQYWVDSLYMLPPALICGGHIDEAIRQADGYIAALYDEDRGLFHHIWDDAERRFINIAYWGVGNGWAISGLSRLINALPPEKDAVRARYTRIVKRTIESALALCEGGMFHDFLDQNHTFLEVNFAQMLCYTIAKGTKAGWLPAEMLAQAQQIRAEIHKHVSPYGLVQDVCGAPSFNKPGIAPEAQAFFILMESAFS